MTSPYCKLLVLTLLSASMLACTYVSRQPQYSLAVLPASAEEAALIRDAVKKFSNEEGFLKMTKDERFERDGQHLVLFDAADKSFVFISNLPSEPCYTIAVYSSVDATTARGLGERLKQVLRSTFPAAKHASDCAAA